MAFCKRLMDVYLVTETNLCPRCGKEWGYRRDDEAIKWHDITHEKWCSLCQFHFRLRTRDGVAVLMEVIE
jgi:hypothetical protein